jgi:hypothetical protein
MVVAVSEIFLFFIYFGNVTGRANFFFGSAVADCV